MHQTGAAARILTRVHFGFSASHLFVRLDGERRLADLLAEGYGFSLTFLHPTRQRLEVEPSGRGDWSGAERAPGSGWRPERFSSWRSRSTISRRGPASPIAFFVSASLADGPAGAGDGTVSGAARRFRWTCPGTAFSGDNWRA